MSQPNTHLLTDPRLVGAVVSVGDAAATAELQTTANMAVDAQGLVHGGFVFGLADYAAMLAVNDPNVVLGGADVRFLKPVAAGALVRATAQVDVVKGRKHIVLTSASVGDVVVFEGTFTCFVLDEHVLGA